MPPYGDICLGTILFAAPMGNCGNSQELLCLGSACLLIWHPKPYRVKVPYPLERNFVVHVA